MSRRTASRALIAVALSVSLAACGSDDGADSPDSSSSAAAGEVSTDLSEKPEVPASDEPAPDELVIDDVVVGHAPEADEGRPPQQK